MIKVDTNPKSEIDNILFYKINLTFSPSFLRWKALSITYTEYMLELPYDQNKKSHTSPNTGLTIAQLQEYIGKISASIDTLILENPEFISVQISEISTNTDAIKIIRDNLDKVTLVMGRSDRAMHKARTHEGLQAARARGRVGGKPQKLTTDERTIVRTLMADPNTDVMDIAKRFGISRATLYRILKSNI
jgi:uncharacterized membrane protein